MTIEDIKSKLLEAKENYYSGHPIMSDSDFDSLEEQLRNISPKDDYFDVVGSHERGKKIQHSIRMRSMSKCNTQEHVEAWYKRNNYYYYLPILIQEKLDGLSGTLRYKNGKLTYAATRGSGDIGQDVTRHVNLIASIPKSISERSDVEIRGEFIAPKVSPLRELYPDSPLRNLVAGIINRKETTPETVYVEFVAYGVERVLFYGEEEKEHFLNDNGFKTVTWGYCKNQEEVFQYYYDMITKREDFPYELDGLILKPTSCDLQRELEDGNEHHPVWATAWKFPAQSVWTTLRGISYNTSRLGKMIPVAEFDTVVIGGSNISRATLNNQKWIIDKNLQIGDEILVEKANDVIPKIVDNRAATNRTPLSNPVCGCGQVSNGELNGVHISCSNEDCSERKTNEIVSWIRSIGVENVSLGTVKTLYEEGLVKSIIDLYSLSPDKLKEIRGIGDLKIQNLFEEIERTRSMSELDLLSKLGIESVGEKSLKKLGIDSIDSFLNFSDSTYVVGQKIIEWKSEPRNISFLNELKLILNLSKTNQEALHGVRVCATGKAPVSRSELVKRINGSGKFVWIDGVGKETQLLVTDDLNSDSSKMTKAKKMGIEIITYEEFFSRM